MPPPQRRSFAKWRRTWMVSAAAPSPSSGFARCLSKAMSAKSRLPELLADPFQERRAPEFHKVVRVLGAEIRFESNSPELMKLVDRAYAGLPAHRLPGAPM